MQVHKLPFEHTGSFSSLFLDYIYQNDNLKSFYDKFPSPENFITEAQSINFSKDKRKLLNEALVSQYNGITISSLVNKNLDALLEENSFTITTGHQLNIFTGPLYFILKILTVIKTAEKLNGMQKEKKFIPVYWMASEDHDKEEINHFYLFNKKYTWETEQQGAVGKFSTSGIEKIFPEIKDKLPLFEKAYLEHKTLSEATRYLVNELFGEYGLLIIDGDDAILKATCREIFKDDLINNTSYKKVKEDTDKLIQLGYQGQVYARDINLFYMNKGVRERFIHEDGIFKVNNTDIKFSEVELNNLLQDNIEQVSPNVILRPLYQEVILPNVCYCGGPAEVSYWLQLKSLFDHYRISFPILLPRVFSLIIQKNNYSKIQKLKLQFEDLFEDEQKLKERIIASSSSNDYQLGSEEREIENIFGKIKSKASAIDPSLEGFVLAEGQKVKKALEQIEKRLKKAEEQKHDVALSQLSNIKSKLFPEGQLQERRDNFLNFYLSDPPFISKLYSVIDPFDLHFNIIVEDE